METRDSFDTYLTPWQRTWVRNTARVSLGFMGLVGASGAFDFSAEPLRPNQVCWDTIGDHVREFTEGVPGPLLAIDSDAPPRPPVDPQAKSAALEARPPTREPSHVEQLLSYREVQRFATVGGMTVTVKRDAQLPIDGEAFNSMITTLLEAEYDDPNVQAHMYCLKHYLLSENRFEGVNLDMYIPASRRACMRGPFVTIKEDSDSCNSHGATLPNPRLFAWLPMMDGWRLTDNQVIIATAGATENQSPAATDAQITSTIAHEVMGHLLWSLEGTAFSLTPQGLNYDEQHAESVEGGLRQEIARHGGWPRIVPFIDE